MKRIVAGILGLLATASAVEAAPAGCAVKGKPFYGRVQVVKAFPDVRVKLVRGLEDLRVQRVSALPTRCGQWQLVTSLPDLKVQFVDAFEDITIRWVDAMPGLGGGQ